MAAAAMPPPRPLPVSPLRPHLVTRDLWNIISGAADGDLADPESVGNPDALRIPAVGSGVFYYPSLHASPDHGPILPKIYDCCLHAVVFQADPITHDIIADVTLGRKAPIPNLHPPPAAAPPLRFFSKRLSRTDIEKERVAVGKAGDRLFGGFRPKKNLQLKGLFGVVHKARRNAHTVIDQGWPAVIDGKGLKVGDHVYFVQQSGGEKIYMVGFRKSFTAEEVAMTRPSAAAIRGVLADLRDNKLVRVRIYLGRSDKILDQVVLPSDRGSLL